MIVFTYLSKEIKIRRLHLPNNVSEKYTGLLKEDRYKKDHVISIDLCIKKDETLYVITAGTSSSPTDNFFQNFYFNLQGLQTGSFLINEISGFNSVSTGEQIPLFGYDCRSLITDEKGIRNSW